MNKVIINGNVFSTSGQRLVLHRDGTITVVGEPNPHVYKANVDRMGYATSCRKVSGVIRQ